MPAEAGSFASTEGGQTIFLKVTLDVQGLCPCSLPKAKTKAMTITTPTIPAIHFELFISSPTLLINQINNSNLLDKNMCKGPQIDSHLTLQIMRYAMALTAFRKLIQYRLRMRAGVARKARWYGLMFILVAKDTGKIMVFGPVLGKQVEGLLMTPPAVMRRGLLSIGDH